MEGFISSLVIFVERDLVSGGASGFPDVGQEIAEALDVVGGKAGEEVEEVGVGVDAVSPGRFEEAEEGRGGAAALVASREQPVLAAHRREGGGGWRLSWGWRPRLL